MNQKCQRASEILQHYDVYIVIILHLKVLEPELRNGFQPFATMSQAKAMSEGIALPIIQREAGRVRKKKTDKQKYRQIEEI